MSYSECDWRYLLPWDKRVPAEVVRSLPPWMKRISRLTPEAVRNHLAERWKDVPRYLAPLRDRILSAEQPAIVGHLGTTFLELTFGPTTPKKDWPWFRRTWSTTTRFLPDKARAFLVSRKAATPAEAAGLDKDELIWRCYEELDDEHPIEVEEEEEDWEWHVYVPPPTPTRHRGKALKKIGFGSTSPVAEFLRFFDGLRESLPGHAGGFIPCSEWHTMEEEAGRSKDSWIHVASPTQRRKWSGSVTLFHARNGDELRLNPGGRIGWMLHEEARIRAAWKTPEACFRAYARALDYRWPFDAYGPDQEAVEALHKRRSRTRN